MSSKKGQKSSDNASQKSKKETIKGDKTETTYERKQMNTSDDKQDYMVNSAAKPIPKTDFPKKENDASPCNL